MSTGFHQNMVNGCITLMNLEQRELLNTMQTIKQFIFIHIIIIVLSTIPIYGKSHFHYKAIAKESVFLNFNFGEHYVDVKEKRNYYIDTGELTWYRYPAFSYTKPAYWYFIDGVNEIQIDITNVFLDAVTTHNIIGYVEGKRKKKRVPILLDLSFIDRVWSTI